MASYPGSVWAGHTAPATLAGPPTHEDMHEDVSDELVAVQTELGTNPSGSDATVAARLDKLDGARNFRFGVESTTTDASGDATVSFGGTYGVAPGVIVGSNDSGASHIYAAHTITTTGCKVRVRASTTGAVVASGAALFTWIAWGP